MHLKKGRDKHHVHWPPVHSVASTCSTISSQVSRDRGLDLILHHGILAALALALCGMCRMVCLALCGMVCLDAAPTAANAAPSSPTQSDFAITV